MGLRHKTLACAIAGAATLLASPAAPAGAMPLRGATSGPANMFGPLIGADSLDNFHVGGPYNSAFAYRFRAQWTGTVDSVRFYAILNTEERPKGYSGGTGGRFRVSLVADTGGANGVPGENVLAHADYDPTRANLFPRVRFPATARVERGRFYDIVFTNVDPVPVENYASVNTLYQQRSMSARPRSIAADVSLLWADGVTDRTGPIEWQRDPLEGDGHFPVVHIAGREPGQDIGYGFMEVWTENPKPIGGEASVRERFTFDRPRAARVSKVWIRLRRTSIEAAPLQLRLETLAGETIATAMSAANRVPLDHAGWVMATFSHAPTLRSGQRVALVLRARSVRAYEIYPLRDGSGYGFPAATVFGAGYAQFDSGKGWKGWTQWGKYDRHDGDLQFGLGLRPAG